MCVVGHLTVYMQLRAGALVGRAMLLLAAAACHCKRGRHCVFAAPIKRKLIKCDTSSWRLRRRMPVGVLLAGAMGALGVFDIKRSHRVGRARQLS